MTAFSDNQIHSIHLHIGFSPWTNASRAFREGFAAIEHGYATHILYAGYKSENLATQETLDSQRTIVRLGASPAPPGSSRIRRALVLPRWWQACMQELPHEGVKLVIAHSLAALPVAERFARKHRLPLLYDAHELETERAGWSWPIRRIARIVESFLIQKCDHVIVVNDSIRDWYIDAYPGIQCNVVRNVPTIPEQIGQSNLRAMFELPEEALIFVYCGVLGRGRGLAEMIEAFRKLDDNRHLIFIGYGHDKDSLKEQSHGLENIHFHEAVPQSELIDLLSGADVGIIVPKTDSLSYKYMLPNKVFEYAAAGLGIIVGTGPELQKFARHYPATKTADLTVESLYTAVKQWNHDDVAELAKVTANYEPPSWQNEQLRLRFAFDRALENGTQKWG